MRTVFNLSVIVTFLLIGFSVFYYFVIFLPNQEQKKLVQQKLEQESKNQLMLYNKTSLDNCLQEINKRRQTVFEDPQVKNINREDLKLLLDQVDKQKDECYRKYPQK